MRLYLSHSAQEQVTGLALQDDLERRHVAVLNPFKGQVVEGTQDRDAHTKIIKAFTDEECDGIVERDLEAVDECDGMVVIWPRYEVPSVGIPMEVMYQWLVYKGRPIFSLAPDEWYANHPWVRSTSDVVTTDIEKLVDIISAYATTRLMVDAGRRNRGRPKDG